MLQPSLHETHPGKTRHMRAYATLEAALAIAAPARIGLDVHHDPNARMRSAACLGSWSRKSFASSRPRSFSAWYVIADLSRWQLGMRLLKKLDFRGRGFACIRDVWTCCTSKACQCSQPPIHSTLCARIVCLKWIIWSQRSSRAVAWK